MTPIDALRALVAARVHATLPSARRREIEEVCEAGGGRRAQVRAALIDALGEHTPETLAAIYGIDEVDGRRIDLLALGARVAP